MKGKRLIRVGWVCLEQQEARRRGEIGREKHPRNKVVSRNLQLVERIGSWRMKTKVEMER